MKKISFQNSFIQYIMQLFENIWYPQKHTNYSGNHGLPDLYLENGPRIFFKESHFQDRILSHPKTTLTAFFPLCQEDPLAKTILYCILRLYGTPQKRNRNDVFKVPLFKISLGLQHRTFLSMSTPYMSRILNAFVCTCYCIIFEVQIALEPLKLLVAKNVKLTEKHVKLADCQRMIIGTRLWRYNVDHQIKSGNFKQHLYHLAAFLILQPFGISVKSTQQNISGVLISFCSKRNNFQ